MNGTLFLFLFEKKVIPHLYLLISSRLALPRTWQDFKSTMRIAKWEVERREMELQRHSRQGRMSFPQPLATDRRDPMRSQEGQCKVTTAQADRLGNNHLHLTSPPFPHLPPALLSFDHTSDLFDHAAAVI
jgi:hypothetical protein